VILLLVLAVVAYLLFGPSDSGTQASDQPNLDMPAGGQVTDASGTKSGTASTEDSTRRTTVGGSLADDVTAVGGYMMGHTQVMVKRNVNKKLDETNAKHNEELNKILSE
jgi:hypothetical protein